MISRDPIVIADLGDGDDRAYSIHVARPAALLIAKTHKLAERLYANDLTGLSNKDAFDIFRLIRAVDSDELAADVVAIGKEPVAATVTHEAIIRFREMFETPDGTGTRLVAQHVEGLEDHDTIVASSTVLSQESLGKVIRIVKA